MTEQEIFNRVWDHFVTKGQPLSVNDSNTQCMYRGPNGEKCAVGLFIPDEKYTKDLEPLCPWSLRPYFEDGVTEDHVKLLSALQDAHDSCPDVESEDRARIVFTEVARRYGLTVPS